MLFEVEAVLELNPAITVSDVVLTIGHGALEYCLFSHVVGASSGGPVPLYAAGKPSTKMFNNPGDGYYVIRQAHISGIRWLSIRFRMVPAARRKSRRRFGLRGGSTG